MHARRIDPPPEDFKDFPTPLTDGEVDVFNYFNNGLPIEWEIYVQPHMNGLRPDIVLLNPHVGVIVVEVKSGKFIIDKDDGEYTKEKKKNLTTKLKQAIRKSRFYAKELSELYCVRRQESSPHIALPVMSILFITQHTTEELKGFHGKSLNKLGFGEALELFDAHNKSAADTEIIYGKDLIDNLDSESVFPFNYLPEDEIVDSDLASDLRNWLVEPEHSREQRDEIILTDRQKDLVHGRTASGYRRVKGAAGSGKSFVLSAKAAHAAMNGKEVAVIVFNITLLNYLRDIAAAYCNTTGKRGHFVNKITWVNYHLWAKRFCRNNSEFEKGYRQMWKKKFEGDLRLRQALGEELAALITRLKPTLDDDVTEYDMILVDEGQDFHPEWWESLRPYLAKDGEMILFSDSGQDIYENVEKWTDRAMTNSGFVGPWNVLPDCHRLPDEIIRLVRDFSNRNSINTDEYELPSLTIQEDLPGTFPCKIRETVVERKELAKAAVEEIKHIVKAENFGKEVAISDIVYLVDDRDVGRCIVRELEQRKIKTHHTFGHVSDGNFFSNDGQERQQKMNFYKGRETVKATTIHSYKGWESRNVILVLTNKSSSKSASVAYIGITRVKKSIRGSSLSVIRLPNAVSVLPS